MPASSQPNINCNANWKYIYYVISLSCLLHSSPAGQSTPSTANCLLHNSTFFSIFLSVLTQQGKIRLRTVLELEIHSCCWLRFGQTCCDDLETLRDPERPRQRTVNFRLVHYCTALADFITQISPDSSLNSLSYIASTSPSPPTPRAKDTWGAKCVLYGWKA